MKVNKFIILVFVSLFMTCNQDVKVEALYQECVYNSLSDNGVAFRRFMTGFENHLIEIEILKDAKPSSYYSLFESIAEKDRYSESFVYSYIDSINKIERYKINPDNKKCIEEISSKIYLIRDTERNKNAKEFNIFIRDSTRNFFDMMSKKLTFLEVEDFELDYYKHKTFMCLYLSSFEHQSLSIGSD